MTRDMWSRPEEWDAEQARSSALILEQRAGAEDQVRLRAARMARGVAARGGITTDELERWLEQLGRVVDAGRFFASLNYYACIGRRPEHNS